MPLSKPRFIVPLRPLAIFCLLSAAALAGGCAQGQYIAHASIEWPGAPQTRMDEVIARPVGRHLFGATNGVLAVTAFSAAGRTDFYATSDGLTKRETFLQTISGSMADAAELLPRGAVASPVDLLPNGQPIQQPAVHETSALRIDIDRAKLIDAGLSYDDVSRAIAKAREQDEAFRLSANVSTTAPAAQHLVQALSATTLPSHPKPLTLGDVAHVYIVAEPNVIERHWP